ncbi:hypothetical protein D3C78_1378210 [compost metagenome]
MQALLLKRSAAQRDPLGAVTIALQGEDQGIGDGGFVFDDQDMGHLELQASSDKLQVEADWVTLHRSAFSCSLQRETCRWRINSPACPP